MNKISKGFTTFMMTLLKVLLFIMVVCCIGKAYMMMAGFDISFITLLVIFSLSIYGGYKLINSKWDNKKKIGIILVGAFVLRVLWLINIKSVPTSDFNTMYETAKYVLKGDYSMLWGTGYIARFPHLTTMVLYFALMIKLFPVSHLLAIKIVNLALGVLVVYLIYIIIKKVFKNEKHSLYAGLFAAIFPPLITYTGVFCSENVAIPFYLLSIYLFITALKEKSKWWLLIPAGIALSVGNLFRTVAVVTVVAYALYIILYGDGKTVNKVKNIIAVVLSFYLVLWGVSGVLQKIGVTENPLWRGSEPALTNILKGTNIENMGRWNLEDTVVPEECNFDYDKIEEVCKERIIERLTTTPPLDLGKFYMKKFVAQWVEGDLAGVFWSQLDVDDSDIIMPLSSSANGILQIIYSVMMILTFIGTFNKRALNTNKEVKLFYLMLCGYGAMYLITEGQARYSYIVCWLFILLAIAGLDVIGNRKGLGYEKTNKNK